MNQRSLFLLTGLLAASGTGGAQSEAPRSPSSSTSTASQIKSADAMRLAEEHIRQQAKDGKLEPSWIEVKAYGATLKNHENALAWSVAMHNNKINDAAKSTIHVIFSQQGQLLDLRFAGR